MPKSKIIKTIPDRVFCKLWTNACDDIKIYEFIDLFTNPLSKKYIDFHKKYKMDELQAVCMLENIYRMAHLSVKDIINSSGKRKSDIGYIFCIPIRTLEDWYSGKNKCPSYAKLMMLKKFGLFSLGKYIYLESDNHVVYNAYKGSRGAGEQCREEAVVLESEEINELHYAPMPDKDYYMISMKDYEQLHVHNRNKDIEDIIAATDYLRDYMKNGKNRK